MEKLLHKAFDKSTGAPLPQVPLFIKVLLALHLQALAVYELYDVMIAEHSLFEL